MKTIIYNIGTLAGILPAEVRRLEGAQMNQVECIENAYLVIEDGIITDFGSTVYTSVISSEYTSGISSEVEKSSKQISPLATLGRNDNGQKGDEGVEYIDAKGGFVMPAFCDSHTHIVYAG